MAESITGAEILREFFRICVRKMGLMQKSDAACCGITVGQCHALVEIGRVGAISLSDLSQQLNLDKSTMSRTVDNLVNGELVERQIDREDRRYAKITLTPKGAELFGLINQNIESCFQHVLEEIPDDKRVLVMSALPYLLTAVNNSELCVDIADACLGSQSAKKEGCNCG